MPQEQAYSFSGINPERVVFSCKIVKAKIELDDQTKYGKRIVKVLDD